MKTNKIVLFLLGGGITYGLKSGITFFFTEILKLQYWISYIIALIVVIIFAFFYNFHITFKNKKNKKRKFLIYSATLLTFMFIEYSLVIFLTSILLFHYLISIIIITLFLVMIKFTIYNKFIFKKKQLKLVTLDNEL